MSNRTFWMIVLVVVIAVAGWAVYVFYPRPEVAPLPQPKKIGVMYWRQHADAFEGFKRGMKKLGYENAVLDEVLISTTPAMLDEIDRASRKFVESRMDMIFVTMEHAALGALKVTKEMQSNIPIVFLTRFHDPEKYGLIDSFRSSGNNATGVATNLAEIVQKNLEFIKAINPAVKKIGVFGDGFMVPGLGDELFSELKAQAPKSGFTVVEYKTKVPPPEAERAWHETAAKIKKGDIDAIFHIAGHFYDPQERVESDLAIRLGIPMAAPSEDMPNGGHFAYADDFGVAGEQAATLTDKVFKGVKPSSIPIEFGAKSILVLNLKRARQAGFTFPQLMLDLADVKVDE